MKREAILAWRTRRRHLAERAVWRQEGGAVAVEPFAPVGAELRAAAEAEAARLHASGASWG